MPRGIAIPELRERLFLAAERLLAREGPSGLSTRAIATEAECAKGVLHNHFTDLDGFLMEFVQSRFHVAMRGAAELRAKAGQGSVEDNLAQAAASLFSSPVLAVHSIVTFRPSLAARLRERHKGQGRDSPNLAHLEHIFAAYLDAEKKLGRVSPDADTQTAVLALVGTVHYLLIGGRMGASQAQEALHSVVKVLLTTAVTGIE